GNHPKTATATRNRAMSLAIRSCRIPSPTDPAFALEPPSTARAQSTARDILVSVRSRFLHVCRVFDARRRGFSSFTWPSSCFCRGDVANISEALSLRIRFRSDAQLQRFGTDPERSDWRLELSRESRRAQREQSRSAGRRAGVLDPSRPGIPHGSARALD